MDFERTSLRKELNMAVACAGKLTAIQAMFKRAAEYFAAMFSRKAFLQWCAGDVTVLVEGALLPRLSPTRTAMGDHCRAIAFSRVGPSLDCILMDCFLMAIGFCILVDACLWSAP